MGHFLIRHKSNSRHHIKLIQPQNSTLFYKLSTPKIEGVALQIVKSVVQDTLIIKVSGKSIYKAILRIHDFKNTFFSIPIKFNHHEQSLKIPLDALPKGLATVTITDSLERPLAERIFFGHYNVKDKPLALVSNKQLYKKRESRIKNQAQIWHKKCAGIVGMC